jgi:hypothetical protein
MYADETAMIAEKGFAIQCKAEPDAAADANKLFFMHTIGMTAIGRPEYIVRNFHKSLQGHVGNALMAVYSRTMEGFLVENNHGVNTNNMKLVCLTPSASELKLLEKEFVTAPADRYGKYDVLELFLLNAVVGKVAPERGVVIGYTNVPPRLEALRGCTSKKCRRIQDKNSAKKDDILQQCSACRSVGYCKFHNALNST